MTHHSKGLIEENTIDALYFETRMFSGYANNCDYMAIFDRLFTIFQ